jgi:hypothetical protein
VGVNVAPSRGHLIPRSDRRATPRHYFDVVAHRVYFETTTTTTFAISLDWPGWCRRGRSEDEAFQRFLDYRDRYEAIVGVGRTSDEIIVIGTTPGTRMTDFGAPRARGPWDDTPAPDEVRRAHVEILQKCWTYFDDVVAHSVAELTRGPRGGGRDRDRIVDHVREAERHYSPKVGVRIAPRTPWSDQRTRIIERLNQDVEPTTWPIDYALRIIAGHIVDHAWEIEDKQP